MVLLEAQPRAPMATPVEDGNSWVLRKEPCDKLLKSYHAIPSLDFDPKLLLFNTSSVTYKANADRFVFADAGVPWAITDAIWDRWYPDGNIPQSDSVRELTIERTPFSLSIGDPAKNIRAVLHLNIQNSLFLVEMRPFEMEFTGNGYVSRAKDFLGQSKDKYISLLGHEYDSYHRTYDIYEPDKIERDFEISQSLLNLLKILSDQGELVKVACSDDDFSRRYPEYAQSIKNSRLLEREHMAA